jgi:glutathione peroxidase-family protein
LYRWNFEKFLIGRDGKIVDRWASTKKPEDLESLILVELKKSLPPAEAKAEAEAETES